MTTLTDFSTIEWHNTNESVTVTGNLFYYNRNYLKGGTPHFCVYLLSNTTPRYASVDSIPAANHHNIYFQKFVKCSFFKSKIAAINASWETFLANYPNQSEHWDTDFENKRLITYNGGLTVTVTGTPLVSTRYSYLAVSDFTFIPHIHLTIPPDFYVNSNPVAPPVRRVEVDRPPRNVRPTIANIQSIIIETAGQRITGHIIIRGYVPADPRLVIHNLSELIFGYLFAAFEFQGGIGMCVITPRQLHDFFGPIQNLTPRRFAEYLQRATNHPVTSTLVARGSDRRLYWAVDDLQSILRH